MAESNQRTNSMEGGSQARATVEKKTQKPAGLLPKNTQQLVILVVAVVMVLIMWLTGNGKRGTPATTSAPGSRVESLDPAAVQEFKQSIQKDQAATRQPVSQGDRGRLEALGLADRIPPGTVPSPDGTTPPSSTVIGATSEKQSSPPDPVKEDKKKREYLSLFAPNVAFTSRTGQGTGKPVGEQHEGLAAPCQRIHEALTLKPGRRRTARFRIASCRAQQRIALPLGPSGATDERSRNSAEIRKPQYGISHNHGQFTAGSPHLGRQDVCSVRGNGSWKHFSSIG